MTHFRTYFYFNREIAADRLTDAIAQACAIPSNEIHVATLADFEREPWAQVGDGTSVSVLTETIRGEFPFVVGWLSQGTPDVRETLAAIARDLDVVILTDAIEVDPFASDWYAIGPNGAAVVHGSSDEFWSDDPAVILEPQSRNVYASLRTAVPV